MISFLTFQSKSLVFFLEKSGIFREFFGRQKLLLDGLYGKIEKKMLNYYILPSLLISLAFGEIDEKT